MKFFEDIEAFNNYPWGHESYELTVKYLLAPLSPKTNNLFSFLWTFMVWAFEVIPPLRQQVTTKGEVSSPRILRWLTTKNVKNYPNLFNLSNDADMVDAAVRADVNIDVGVGVGVGAGGDGKRVRLPLVVDFLDFYVRSARNKMTMLSNQEEKNIIYQENIQYDEKNIWRIVNGHRRENGAQEDGYLLVPTSKKATLLARMVTKDHRELYAMHHFEGNYFKNMTSIPTWWEDW
ncbi:hypothetical protein KY290_036324 [Solanum tuberosum]|uniref:DUF1985 domain-containing protein n=1 Tax=Solanum tuberosum TaxID=4113 RepID=A0ABQ7TSB1_SOLTU|nr:hypothetical protein KY285_035612 [Solanum tuberosum]KAH0737619.1 hypothetical protein KY290_036324 [Solanum tuberosum]